MKCEEFEAMGLDAERDASRSEAERAAATEHVNSCAHCAALVHSWQEARRELHAFAEETAAAQAPARVEMRLRQEFRTQHRTLNVRRTAVATAWALAAVAVLIAVLGWMKWRDSQQVARENHSNAPAVTSSLPRSGGTGASNAGTDTSSGDENTVTLVADNESGDFTLLPGVLASDIDNADLLRVRMQRGALGAFGLPVNEDLASEWIQVDVLVGDDGSPQAVRLLQQQ